MSIKQIRNYNYFPNIYEEGFFAASIREPPVKEEEKKKTVWHKGLEPYARLFFHHTLSSARRHANFINIKSPKDSLDLILNSEYDHSQQLFKTKERVFTQPETVDKTTFRRLRNTHDFHIPAPIPLSHPLKKGGIGERNSVHSVKLINSGCHSNNTNHGFSRQSVDGNFFNY